MTETMRNMYLEELKTETEPSILFQLIQRCLAWELEEKFNIPEIEYTDNGHRLSLNTDYGNLAYCVDYRHSELMFGHIPNKHVQIKNYLISKYNLKYLGKYRYNTEAYGSCTETFIKFECNDYEELKKAILMNCSVFELRNDNREKDKIQNNSMMPKNNRMYNLPKYICYDKAESRNRERNVFQTQLRINNKLYKNNLYTVKDALVYNVKNMLEHTDVWPLDKIAEYIKSYNPEMENGKFIPSNTPKSPSVRKREKAKNIKQVKSAVSEKLKDLIQFAKDNNIDINVEVK